MLLSANYAFAISADDQAARNAALQCLGLLDSGRYAEGYRQFPPRVLAGGKEAQFVSYCKARRFPMGHPIKRSFFRVTHTHKLMGAPDGNYEIILFRTKFERKADGAEGLVLTNETGRWQVSGYKVY
jgi:hypothetical protein